MRRQWPLDSAIAFDPILGEANQAIEQGAELLEDGRVHVRLIAPNASKVELDNFGKVYELQKLDGGAWEGTFDMGEGFVYVFVRIDGADVLSPFLPIGYGCCRPMNYIDVPVKGEDFYALRDVPHGAVARRYFPSRETGKTESCLVYTPPAYTEARKYPVLYLQHGHGENETGWVYQGRVARIADNLLSEGRIAEMIIVMGNGMTQRGKKAVNGLYVDVLGTDLIPYIESHYSVKADKWSRAMAGLSMGSYQTSVATLSHPETFGYAGLFSGFLRAPWGEKHEPHLALLDTPDEFHKSFKVFYRAMGTGDTFWKDFADDDAFVEEKGVSITRRTFGGGHDWTVWRRCIYDFLPMIFKD